MNDDAYRLELSFKGRSTENGTMDVVLFAYAILGVDAAFKLSASLLNLDTKSVGVKPTQFGLRIDARIKQGSIVTTLISTASGFVPGDAVDAVKAILWVTKGIRSVLVSGISDSIRLKRQASQYKEFRERSAYRVDNERLRRDRTAMQLREATARSEKADAERLGAILRLYREATKHVGGGKPELILEEAQRLFFDSSLPRKVAPAVAQIASPVAKRESNYVMLDAGDTPPVILTKEDVPKLADLEREAQELEKEAEDLEQQAYEAFQAHEAASAKKDASIVAVISIVGPRLDGKGSGWSIGLKDRVVRAKLEDVDFVNRVASGAQIIMPSMRFRVSYREKPRSVVIERVLEVLKTTGET